MTDTGNIDQLAEARAKELLAEREFNAACNSTYEAGRQEFTDFEGAIRTLGRVGDEKQTKALVEAATSLPDAHRLLRHLGTNPEEASRIMSLSPARMAIELGRLSAAVAPKSEATEVATKPARSTPRDPEQMNTAEWMAWRNKNVRRR